MNEDLEKKLQHLNAVPGVYLFKNSRSEVIYVGKARRLNQRIRSYFQQSSDHTGKVRAMIKNTVDLEIIVTDSEAEALILENNLIKEHRPRYNILYRDDKSYPYICVTSGNRPRVFPTRSLLRDGNRYFGPYDHVGKMKLMLETIRKAFGLCSCACSSRMIDQSRKKPAWGKCFEEYFRNCSAELPEDVYKIRLEQVIRLLNGKTRELIRELNEEMKSFAEVMQFEKAALLRDGIQAIRKYSEKMKMVTSDGQDRDIFALETDLQEEVACGLLFQIREGKLIGKQHRFLKNIEGYPHKKLLQFFIEEYVTSERSGEIPDEVCLSHHIEDDEPLLEYLWQKKGRKVPVYRPQRGEKAQLVHMAAANARLLLKEWIMEKKRADTGKIPHSVLSLQKDLLLSRIPRRIECFDVSGFHGSHNVASMVCFVDGRPRKSEYKKYHIREVAGGDDFASMRQVIGRRYRRLIQESGQLPDLIVIDGGKGQLSSARIALQQAGISGDIPVIGLAKRLEEVFFPGDSQSLMIPKTSSGLKLLQRIRDEAHRFAVGFHRKVRSRHAFRSELEEIPGIGIKTADMLIRKFGSVQKIMQLDQNTLEQLIGPAKAGALCHYISKKQSSGPGITDEDQSSF